MACLLVWCCKCDSGRGGAFNWVPRTFACQLFTTDTSSTRRDLQVKERLTGKATGLDVWLGPPTVMWIMIVYWNKGRNSVTVVSYGRRLGWTDRSTKWLWRWRPLFISQFYHQQFNLVSFNHDCNLCLTKKNLCLDTKQQPHQKNKWYESFGNHDP